MQSGSTESQASKLLELASLKLVAVLVINDPDEAANLVRTLVAGGIKAFEITQRSPLSLEVVRTVREEFPDLLVGAGTILSPAQAEQVKAAGANFALAPGLDAATSRHCASLSLPFIPGIATATDIQAAVALGHRLLKFFPAKYLGGVRGLRALAAPFIHLDIKFMPLGEITADALPEYLAEPCVAAIGGSWIATPELIKRRAWAEIQKRAEDAVAMIAKSSVHCV